MAGWASLGKAVQHHSAHEVHGSVLSGEQLELVGGLQGVWAAELACWLSCRWQAGEREAC